MRGWELNSHEVWETKWLELIEVELFRLSNEKQPSCLGYIGDEILPSFMRIISYTMK